MKITIECDNDAFGETRESKAKEACRIIGELKVKLATVGERWLMHNRRIPLFDRNGNKVGECDLEDD